MANGAKCAIRARDAGGGGYCLFHIIAAALQLMTRLSPIAAQHVLPKLALETVCGSKAKAVASLRALSADRLGARHPEAFLYYVLRAVVDQQLGCLNDAWDPTVVV